VFVVTSEGGREVVACYAWCMAQLTVAGSPERLRKGALRAGRYPPAGGAASPAKKFYLHLVPEFEQSPTDELHLVLLLIDIRKTLAR
jgi:hypothetical protein